MLKNIAVIYRSILISGLMILISSFNVEGEPMENPNKLVILWTSGDPDVAHRVCFMYTHNAKKQNWFEEVVLIVWGPSARLLAGDKDLQEKVREMQQDGIVVEACIACADSYGVSEKLSQLDIDVKGMGMPLTNYLKSGYKVLTF